MLLTCKKADNTIRWKEGERLEHLFEQRCDAFAAQGDEGHLAVVTEKGTYTFQQLDQRANQAARYLIKQGLGAGDRIGLMFDKSLETYVALLAVLKIHAAYVPLDAGFPAERLAFIVKDAEVKTIVSLSAFATKLEDLAIPKVFLDSAEPEISQLPAGRLHAGERAAPVDQLCYVIYTSGTTGNPKGVAIEHSSICNFVKVAAEVYGYRPDDRVYQGLTIAFDFSVEELWVPLLVGATLVPGKPGTSLVGDDLADYLEERQITAMCCVPTLLATIERDLPRLRFLLVSGEACPQNLVLRWQRPGRIMLNAYGPTEATVTATLTELVPNKPVTIGGPLPTYTIVILDENKDAAVERGVVGEIGIAGIGLAKGYLNAPELTRRKFIPDFLDIPNNPAKRIYRTGDLGRINEQDEIEFLGRIDTQVKIRGYRIELSEIEAVLLELPQIGQTVVHTFEPEPGAVELIAYYTLKQGEAEPAPAEIAATLRKRLPPYMVPAYLEQLPFIPMTTSNKADRKNLPLPKSARLAAGQKEYVAPETDVERALAEMLGKVMNLERVSLDDHFFHDLGAHSLLMARFCADIRKRLPGTTVSMRDIYFQPTIRGLAQHLGGVAPEEVTFRPERKPLRIPSALEYYRCGALQLLAYVLYGLLMVGLLGAAFSWMFAPGHSALEMYGRIMAASAAIFLTFSALPIALKWLLIGRWKREVIPIWSLRYFRFWLVKSLVQNAPLVLFKGAPLYNLYLRLLGARIGRNTVIQTRVLPVCTDLITIGDRTILRKDALVLGYKAQANYLYTGPITIGHDAIVGEASVLDIDSTIEDGGQFGHASSLQSGQVVPAGKRYHGSPAQETQTDYRIVEDKQVTRLRRVLYSVFQLAGLFLVAIPFVVLAGYHGFEFLLWFGGSSGLESETLASTWLLFSGKMALAGFVLAIALTLAGLLIVLVVPRILRLLLQENKTYALYSFPYFVYRTLTTISNAPFFTLLFGDSMFIVYYLRALGYRLNRIVQTGSNFGLDQRHDSPFLCDIGSGTMVSDRLTMVNAPMSHSSFQLRNVKIGANNYLGNDIVFPADSKTGANCLLATKVMVPIDGPLRENVGLLGSPCFEIPRVVARDMGGKLAAEELRPLLRKKARKNLVTMVLLLLSRWLYAACVLPPLCLATLAFATHGILWAAAISGLVVCFSLAYFALVERASLGFGRLQAREVSMYDDYFLFHERHWKLSGSPLSRLFAGTPFKNVISRLLGVKLGPMVFDDGCQLFDKTLLEIGAYANLNAYCTFQGHSLEEGLFKSDHIVIGNGCSLGPAVFIHYGVKIGDNVVIDADSFVMKGESADSNTTWHGNPAKVVGGAYGTLKREATASRDNTASLDAVPCPR